MNVLLIDVETINLYDKTVFDFSYIIADIETKEIKEEGAYVITEGFEKIDEAYYSQNKQDYLDMLESGEYKEISMVELRVMFNILVKRKDIKFLSAFNLKFDVAALGYSFVKYAEANKAMDYEGLSKFITILDVGIVATLAANTSGEYVKFCLENNFTTEKGNIKTTAEVFYRYLLDDPTHMEKHMGKQDCIEEFEILSECYPMLSDSDKEKAEKLSFKKAVFYRLLEV